MIITYRHDDGPAEEISTDALSAIDSADIEEAMGGTPWRRIEDQLRGQDPTAMRAILWISRRRTDEQLQFKDVDVPGWRRRLTARLERWELDDILTNLLAEALSADGDAEIDAMLPHLRKLAAQGSDVDAALDALGKGHLVRGRAGSGV